MGTLHVWAYPEKNYIDIFAQNFFQASEHVLEVPQKIWAENPM